jgi:tRNA pseudouridine38-40 synthase
MTQANSLHNIRLDLQYDGTDFCGWARQPGLPSIEGSLMDTLAQILQEEVKLTVAGRTDSGVHARGQVVSFRTGKTVEPGQLRRSANRLLPEAMVITGVSEAPADFDARGSALWRSYSYSVLNRAYPSVWRRRFVYHYPGRLDRELLDRAAALAAGTHDFTAFTPAQTEHSYFVRELTQSAWQPRGDLLIYRVTASSFLRNMVRVLVGTMLEVGRGYRPPGDLEALLEGAGRDRAGVTAPPQGLCLEKVGY